MLSAVSDYIQVPRSDTPGVTEARILKEAVVVVPPQVLVSECILHKGWCMLVLNFRLALAGKVQLITLGCTLQSQQGFARLRQVSRL